ncbi:MAG: sulfatase [Planctomycetaceae bacterium]
MSPRSTLLLVGAALFILGSSADPVLAAEPIRIGVFDLDATPPIGSPLAYTTHKERVASLRMKGLVLLGEERPIVLVAADWIGIGNQAHDRFREVLADAVGTDPDRVAVHCLHQHDAPFVDFGTEELLAANGLGGRRFNVAWVNSFLNEISVAAKQAAENTRTVTHIGIGRAKVEKVASNRRILGADGKVQHVRYTACADPEIRAFPEGTIDPLLRSISFYDGDELLSVVTYYATHPQSYYRLDKAHPDFPGMAREARQLLMDATHIHFNGAGGNIGAGKYNDGSHPNRAVLASRMADGMRRALENSERIPVTAADLGWTAVSVTLPTSNRLHEADLLATLQNTDANVEQRDAAARDLTFLRRCQHGPQIDIGCLRLGPARVLHMPGELFVEYQLAAAALRPNLLVAMASYGDYGPGYIGTKIAYSQGGYETGPVSRTAPDVEGVLMTAIANLLEVDAAKVETLGAEAVSSRSTVPSNMGAGADFGTGDDRVLLPLGEKVAAGRMRGREGGTRLPAAVPPHPDPLPQGEREKRRTQPPSMDPDSQSTTPTPPNILLVLVDDLGWTDLGCYGSTFYETPHTDRLAAEGMRFTTAYSAAPVCSPTRASLMTGKSPARLGFTGHITAIMQYRYPPEGRILPPQDHMLLRLEETTLAEALHEAGYVSASIGKWHLGPEGYWPEDQGFDLNIAGWTHGSPPSHFFPYTNSKQDWNASIPTIKGGQPGEYLTDRLTDEAVRFIEQNRDRPFFCYLTHYAVHTPIQAPADLTAKYQRKLATDSSQKNATYAAMIERVDTGIGLVMDTLDRLELAERTVVIFFSDNGGLSQVTNNAPLREGKQFLYEGGLRVPLIVKWPGVVEAGTTCDVPVISHDLFPTIVEVAGLNVDTLTDLDGVSLRPLLTSDGELPSRTLYWYYPHYARRPGAAVRDGDLKLIEWYDPPGVELYNIADDLSETNNLAPQLPTRAAELRADLTRWLSDINATLHTPNANFRPSAASEQR